MQRGQDAAGPRQSTSRAGTARTRVAFIDFCPPLKQTVGSADKLCLRIFERQRLHKEPPRAKMGKRVAYTLDSTLDSVNKAEQTADSFAEEVGFGEDDRHKITMSVREAAVNAVLHGNAYDPTKKITVAYEADPFKLSITISDEGSGLSESQVPDPLAEENLLKTSGRGIFLIRSFMDEVRIRELQPGTEITLVKFTSSPPAEHKEQSR